jgi:hypothetical protein
VSISKPTALPAGECIELVAVTVSAACPVSDGTTLNLGFEVKAKTKATGLTWRRSSDSFDALFPSSGTVDNDGTTSVSATDVALADRVGFEVVDGQGRALLRFTLRHR